MRSAIFIVGCWALGAGVGLPADLAGADAAIERMTRHETEGVLSKLPDPAIELRQGLMDARQLPPAEAAARWMDLLRQYSAWSGVQRSRHKWGDGAIDAQTFLQSLPPASGWKEFARVVDTQAGEDTDPYFLSLRLMTAVMREDAPEWKKQIAALRKAADEIPMQVRSHFDLDDSLDKLEAALAYEPADRLAVFEGRLKDAENRNSSLPYIDELDVTDLVKVVGREKAEPLLRRMVRIGSEIKFHDEETHRLEVQIAMEEIDRLQKPMWFLVEGLEDASLFEALERRFPKEAEERGYGYEDARRFYLLSLIAAGRTKDAAKYIRDHHTEGLRLGPHEELSYLQNHGLTAPTIDFLEELLSQDPSLAVLCDYVTLCSESGEMQRAEPVLRGLIARPNVPAESLVSAVHACALRLLATDRIEEGVQALRILLLAAKRDAGGVEQIRDAAEKAGLSLPAESAKVLAEYGGGTSGFQLERFAADGFRLARIGRLLERPAWVEEGLQSGLALLERGSGDVYASGMSTAELLQFGKAAEIEKLLLQGMEKKGAYAADIAGTGANLAEFYRLADRPEETIRLLDRSPYWKALDLAECDNSILSSAAFAFAASGRKEEARRAVRRLLERRDFSDSVFALFLELGGDDVEARLDRLAKAYRFEKRPLIWKAKFLLDAGRLDEAEKTARAAIAIDPADAEAGRGDRMRAYAVLGDILEKKGDTAEAKTMRGVVAAIRLAEIADEWAEAGLAMRATQKYEEALRPFADAYCIELRLAKRYSEIGDAARAEAHYQRSFELMPASFGRAESECFACEGVFSTERARVVAERILKKIAAEQPARAQVPYLLGYMYQEEGRLQEAAVHYRRAVQLDPDYAAAWHKLGGLSYKMSLPEQEREQIALAEFRLRQTGDFRWLRHLPAFWDMILDEEKQHAAPEKGPIYPLAAAQVFWEKRRLVMNDRAAVLGLPADTVESVIPRALLPNEGVRQWFAEHPVVKSLAGVLDAVITRNDESAWR